MPTFAVVAWLCHQPIPYCLPHLAERYFVSNERFETERECEGSIGQMLKALPIVDGDTVMAECRKIEEDA